MTDHRCPTCDITQGLKDARTALNLIDAAANAWIEESADIEGEAAHLQDLLSGLITALETHLSYAIHIEPEVREIVDEAKLAIRWSKGADNAPV